MSAESTQAATAATIPVAQKRVLVIGANGQVGKHLVAALQKDPRYIPLAMIRNVDQQQFFHDMGVQTVLGDLEYPLDHVLNDKMEIEVVVFTAGSGSHTPPAKTAIIDFAGAIKAFATAQQTSTVQRFIMVSGTNVAPDSESPIKEWHRAKFFVDDWIRNQHTAYGRKLAYTILCPSRLTNEALGGVEVGPEYLVSRDKSAVEGGGVVVRPTAATSRATLAATIVAAIDEASTFDRTFRVLDDKDQTDIAAVLKAGKFLKG